MSHKRWTLAIIGLLILASLAACAPVPPATQESAQQAPAARADVAPAASNTPAPSPTPVPSPTPAVPDPKTDPSAALLYAGSGTLFKTAEFTYTMNLTMAPADDASAKALGVGVEQLKNAAMEAKGSGALAVTDPNSLKSKMRMNIDINAAGQQMSMQMILIDKTGWIKLGGQDTWQKVEGDQVNSAAPGMNPEQMLEDFKNAVDVKWIEDVTQGTETLSHLQFTMDPTKLNLGSLTSGAVGSANMTPEEVQAMVKDMKPVVDVWLAKPALELRGEKMQLEFVMPLPSEANVSNAKIRMNIVMDMQFSKVNEPVTIEPPTS